MPTHHHITKLSQLSVQTKYRWMVFIRMFTAFIGGYILTAYITSVLAQLVPLPRAEAVVLSALLSYLWFCLVIVWVFAVNSTAKACWGVVIAIGCFAGLDYVLRLGWVG